MIDEYTKGSTARIANPEQIEAEAEGLVRFKNATFTWGSASGKDTPGFRLWIPDVTFVKGKINVISGPTGCGKSSLLKVSFRSFMLNLTLIPITGSYWGAAFHSESRIVLSSAS